MRKRASILAVMAFATASSVLAASHSTVAFKKRQVTAGAWEGTDDKHQPVKSNFKSIVSNTAVMETLSPSGMEEMVTVYSLDGDGIALVHFCPANNQPRMRAVPSTDEVKELVFDFQGASNLPSPNTATSITWSSGLRMKIASRKYGPGGTTEWTCRWFSISPARKSRFPKRLFAIPRYLQALEVAICGNCWAV
jgi:hypothetical protein